MFQIVTIADITINERKRVANPAKVQQLAESIECVGLLNPVTITASNVLVAGLHRLAACTSLGWTVIPARILDLEGLEAELAEIDENLIRAELTELQQGVQLARRKEIYVALHPETKHGGDRKSEEAKSNPHNADLIPSFTADTASKTGKSRDVIERKSRIGERLADVADDLAGSAIEDSQKDLLALAALAPEECKEVIESVARGETPDTTEGWREKIEERRPVSRTTYPCSSCGGVFTDPVWHCPRCDHHWPLHRIDCLNCHEYSRPPLPNEMAGEEDLPFTPAYTDDEYDSDEEPQDDEAFSERQSRAAHLIEDMALEAGLDVDIAPATGYDGDEWYTPALYIAAARRVLEDIDLDPASCDEAQATVQAATYYDKECDGLAQTWYGRVWLNPPYSFPKIEQFTGRLIRDYEAGSVTAAILLVNNCTDAAWFHALLERFPVCFTRGRVRFERSDRDTFATRQGQAFFYLGSNVARFVEVFGAFGCVVGAVHLLQDA